MNRSVLATRWPSFPFGSLAEFKNGLNYSKANFGKGIKVIGVADFQDRLFPDYSSLGEIDPTGVVHDEDLLQENDLVFVRSNGNRELIGRSLLLRGVPEPLSHSGFTIRARPFADRVVAQFVAYFFRSRLARQHLSQQGGGTNISNLNQQILSNFPVPLPPLPTQRKIAAILAAYDDLIENNLRRIRILEEMAQALYREWFVEFRFPGHEGVRFVDSPLGRVPEGWEIKSLDFLIENHIGGGWGAESRDETHTEPAWVIRGTDIPRARHADVSSVPRRVHTESNLRSRKLEAGEIVFEVSGGSKGQPVGRALLVTRELLAAFLGESVICASFCKRVQPHAVRFGSELLYLSFLHGYASGEIEEFQVQSTGISNFKWTEYLQSTNRCVPPNTLRTSFRDLVGPLFHFVGTLGLQASVLRRTRDLLLPRLISGELDVSNLDIAVREAVA